MYLFQQYELDGCAKFMMVEISKNIEMFLCHVFKTQINNASTQNIDFLSYFMTTDISHVTL
jgi:hypothetical protein